MSLLFILSNVPSVLWTLEGFFGDGLTVLRLPVPRRRPRLCSHVLYQVLNCFLLLQPPVVARHRRQARARPASCTTPPTVLPTPTNVSLSLSLAFHKRNHNFFLNKVAKHNIKGELGRWIQEFITKENSKQQQMELYLRRMHHQGYHKELLCLQYYLRK